MRYFFLILTASISMACSGQPNVANNNSIKNTANNSVKQSSVPPIYSYEVVHTYPHDPKAFTEGLFYHDGFLYESTGEEGKSSLRKVELETGKVLQKFDLPRDSFGEGIALINGLIYQLTWREHVCRVFDAKDFKLIREFNYQGDGWGMTTDGKDLYVTNSTHVMQVMDPTTFTPTRQIIVKSDDGRPLMQINELEWIKGEIWANIWHSESPAILGKPNYIVRIDPATGKVLGWIDLQGISADDVPALDQINNELDEKAENTLNGIAYDAEKDRIFVTGKNWKHLYEVKLKEKLAAQ
ncbi:MAG: glutaminyl-peptide cyclotransferase [Acidobacteriota bacterium]